MKKTIIVLLCLITFISINNSDAKSAIINFDDIPTGLINSSTEYNGLHWSRFVIRDPEPGTSLGNGLNSAPNLASIEQSAPGSFYAADPFNFLSAWLTTPAFDDKVTVFEGYLNDNIIYNKEVTLNKSKGYFEFDFYNVDKVVFRTKETNPLSSKKILLDDIEVTPVPEPTSLFLGLIGIIGSIFGFRKRV